MATPEPEIIVDNKRQTKPDEPKQADTLLHRLITFEGEAMQSADRQVLKHMAVNKSRILIPMGHAFLCTRQGHKFTVQAISNQAVVNNQAPFLQWLHHILKSLSKGKVKNNFVKPFAFPLKTRRADDDFDYPYAYAYWAPFSPRPQDGGMLFTRDKPWDESEHPVLDRVGQIVGVNWTALAKAKRKPASVKRKTIVSALGLLALIGLAIPVPITTMAQAEITAHEPFIVTAPMDGVIDKIHVKPGTMVSKGTVLATLNDTTYRNEFTLSGEEKAVAAARYRQTSLSAFINNDAKRDLAVMQAEQQLAGARQDYAADRLAKTKLIADRDGLVIYSDEKDWVGRPVAIGEKIMQIADPERVLLRISTPIADSVTMQSGARVRMFLDADPLKPLEAELLRANYYATPQAGGNLAYEADAKFTDLETTPRIGGRGVAKIYGAKAPFGLWLARKPITALRQRIGF